MSDVEFTAMSRRFPASGESPRVDLVAAIDRYIAAVDSAGYSRHSVKAYSTRLNDFARFLGEGTNVGVGADDVQRYLSDLRNRQIGRRFGASPQTVAHAFSILSGFFRYCETTLRVCDSPMRDVIKPRGETSVDDGFKSLTSDQLHQLLMTARFGWAGADGAPDLRTENRKLEEFLLVAFMGLAGLRVSEVCSIDRDDIRDDVVTIIGKGRKQRSVPLVTEILEGLKLYRPPNPGPHLFALPTDIERRVTPNSIEQRIPRLAQRAGIHELRVTPHVLRHTFGSLMLAADPSALIPTRDLMGHSSIETTNKYAHTREEARRLALASFQESRRRAQR